jgi:hypothetical protein
VIVSAASRPHPTLPHPVIVPSNVAATTFIRWSIAFVAPVTANNASPPSRTTVAAYLFASAALKPPRRWSARESITTAGGEQMAGPIGAATNRVRPWAWAAVVGVAASVSVLVWWVVGNRSAGTKENWLVGPYEVGAAPGRAALLATTVVVVAALVDLVRRQRRGEFGLSGWWFVVLIAAAGAAGGYGWRAVTAAGDGGHTNIRGGGGPLNTDYYGPEFRLATGAEKCEYYDGEPDFVTASYPQYQFCYVDNVLVRKDHKDTH